MNKFLAFSLAAAIGFGFFGVQAQNPSDPNAPVPTMSDRIWENIAHRSTKDIEFSFDQDAPWELIPASPSSTDSLLYIAPSQQPKEEVALTLKFNLDKTSAMALTVAPGNTYTTLELTLDGSPFNTFNISEGIQSGVYNIYTDYFRPGDHTLEIKAVASMGNSPTCYFSDIYLHDNLFIIDVTPGELAKTVIREMDAHGYAKLQYVDHIIIKGREGTFNSKDWNDLKSMSGIRLIDLSNTDIQEIPESQFEGSKIERIVLPESVNRIGHYSFRYSNLKSINLPSNLKIIYNSVFDGSKLTEISIPASVETICNFAFANIYSLQNVYFAKDSKLNLIENDAFVNCGLISVELPRSLKKIEKDAFSNNYSLSYVKLHPGAKDLPRIFSECNNIRTLVVPCPTPPNLTGIDILDQELNKNQIELIVPDFAKDDYYNHIYWHQYRPTMVGSNELANADYWRITSSFTLDDTHQFGGTPDVEIDEAGSLTIQDNASASFNNLTLNFKENSYYYGDGSYYVYKPSAILINDCVSTTANGVSTTIYVQPNRWYFISPLFDVNINDVVFDGIENYAFRYYDAESRAKNGYANSTTDGETKTSNWKPVEGSMLKAGQGYILRCAEEGYVTFKGDATAAADVLNPQDKNIELKNIDPYSPADANWNFIGNPYPSYFNIENLNCGAPITVRRFIDEWNQNYIAYSPQDDDYVLRPMEAFFVQKPTAHTSGATFALAGRQLAPEIFTPMEVKAVNKYNSDRKLFNIEILDNEGRSSDRARVVINEAASLEYEISCDASKFMNDNPSLAQIYTVDADGNRLAINERPLADGSVDLVVITGDDNKYTISATRADGEIYLLDMDTQEIVDLSAGDYILNAESNTTISGRFRLMFAPGQSAVENIAASRVKAEAGRGYISVSNPAAGKFTIYSADGKIRYNGADTDVNISTEAGIYVLRTSDKSYKLIVK